MEIADAGGGGAPDFGAIGKGVAEFAASAASGGFAVNETGGQALLQAIYNMRDWIDANQLDLQQLAVEPQLGSSHGAEVMKPHLAQVASDDQGFITMLSKFRDSLDHAEQGIKDAMKNYGNMDQGGAGTFRT